MVERVVNPLYYFPIGGYMIVYVVQRGEQYEGSRILGIFASRREAIRHALLETTHFDDKHWRSKPTMLNGATYWENGCDYLMVTPWRVQ